MAGAKDKGKKKKKEVKKKLPGRNDTAETVCKKFLKTYEKNCAFTDSQMYPGIKDALKKCMENNNILVKFILQVPPTKSTDAPPILQVPPTMSTDAPPILIEPLLATIRHERYTFVKDFYIWDYPMSLENVASLSLMMEKPFYPIRQIELMDCLLGPPQISRLARSFAVCLSLTQISLDYNEFGDEGCYNLCVGLTDNAKVTSLSLCYCALKVPSGKYLAQILSTTAVRELYLDGNELECEGTMELIQLCADQAENEAFEKEEAERIKAELLAQEEEAKKAGRYSPYRSTTPGSGSEPSPTTTTTTKKKKKKGKKKKKAEPPPPPRVGPWIHKLHLADNGIDGYGKGANFAPIICTKKLCTLIINSDCLEELDLDDNLIGDLAARELLEALEKRKEAKLPPLKVRTTHRLNSETFKEIIKLGSGLKKKKKKGKKKKKK